jgi:hypothetical protein
MLERRIAAREENVQTSTPAHELQNPGSSITALTDLTTYPDGVTWQEYETGLEHRLIDLHSRVHRGAYRAQPSRRVYIPKADGRQRPLGIAAVEDKIVHHAVVTILNQIYEIDFKVSSYGFRPGRGPHQALDALAVGIQWKRVNWVLDADIRGSTNDRFLTDAERCPIHRWPGIPREPKISQVHR